MHEAHGRDPIAVPAFGETLGPNQHGDGGTGIVDAAEHGVREILLRQNHAPILALAKIEHRFGVTDIDDSEGIRRGSKAERQFTVAALQVFHMQIATDRSVEHTLQHIIENRIRRKFGCQQGGKCLGEDVPVFWVQQAGAAAQQLGDVGDADGSVSQELGQKQQNVHHVRHVPGVLFPHRRNPAADEHPKRLIDGKRLQLAAALLVQPELLIVGQQAGGQIQVPLVVVGTAIGEIVDVEDVVVLAETISMEKSVGVVE